MAGSVSSSFGNDEGAVISDINVTPMVDVVLVLLIVFMITMPTIIGSTPIKVSLPEVSLATPDPDQMPLDLYLRRSATGEVELYLGQRAEPINYDYLRTILPAKQLDQQPVSLSADKEIAYGDVVKVMDQLAGLGLHKLSLNTKHVAK